MASKRGIAAKQIVRDYGKDLEGFITQLDSIVERLTSHEASLPLGERRREVCAVVWASISAAFNASTLSPEENEAMSPLLRDVLIPYWKKHCAADPDMNAVLAERAAFYLQGRDPKSQVATASTLVRRFLEAIGTSDQMETRLSQYLVPLFAHRMLGDTLHINDLKTRFTIHLPLVAMILGVAGMTQYLEHALRLLRLN